jgi:hypothetical protein
MALQILCEREGHLWTLSVWGTVDAYDYVVALGTAESAPQMPEAVPDILLAREQDLPAVLKSAQRQACEGEVAATSLGAFVFWRAVTRVARATAAWSERRSHVTDQE